ncbi:MAG: hypothetical protein AVDCRST_MAG64-2567 [uncultured Phycisphaerae bacterium]|uniref:DUF429 domain-containing protein n=1 Tax=uncultured Phycisphaerae bacterium TaxID=904963 RepID=A0A6J4PKD6_9BACT|nr:MAG: hypothetical protein AVDCRST_MAG64-2567 [uncultured Phycisphaerae bacterium]
MSDVNGSGVGFDTVYGVDFSGAKLAGRNIWVARLELPRARYPGQHPVPVPVRGGPKGRGKPALVELSSLEQLTGTPERAPALAHLVDLIARSERALWAMDFPFSLPIEVMPANSTWPDQLAFLHGADDDAYGVGLECLERAKRLGGPMHIRRQTDFDARAPFDCYHYRIIYQFFHGVRDVLGPLWGTRGTAVLPFQYRRLARARRVLVEACPSSTLKRLGLPHQNYKQPAGGPLSPKRLRTRRVLLDALCRLARIGDRHRRVMMRNPGGDAIDAVLAAVGGLQSWRLTDHRAVARHARYPREGFLYV